MKAEVENKLHHKIKKEDKKIENSKDKDLEKSGKEDIEKKVEAATTVDKNDSEMPDNSSGDASSSENLA